MSGMPDSRVPASQKPELRTALFAVGAVLSVLASFLFKYGWIAFGLVVIAIVVLTYLPAREAFLACPKCGKVFQLSIAERHGCPREGDAWQVDCRHCGMEVWAREAKDKRPR